jgi:quinoprotein glucose dehydrogenase
MRHPSLIFLLILSLFIIACRPTSDLAITDNNVLAEWSSYGGNQQSNRYSPLNQININNVEQLELAWTHNSGDFSDGTEDWAFTSLQVTPIVTNNTLYYCTPFGRVFALDPISGKELWVFDPEVKNKKGGYYPAVCRGVSYWQETQANSNACNKRILYGTRDAQLIALDADTGKPCTDFGIEGRVALREGIGQSEPWEYYPTSPPLVMNNTVVIGALVPDNNRVDSPGGVVRAFDVKTGTLRWAWDPVSEDYKQRHKSDNGTIEYLQGTPNVWAPISGDYQRGIIFVPTGNPSPDIYGGQRDGIDEFGSSVIALDINTGKLIWNFQTVHHDLWDYDVASQPVLFQIAGVADGREGIIQPTKMGHVFLLDRETGEPLYPVEERPVPQNGVPGENLSPTQPFPTHPKPLHLPEQLTSDNLSNIIWIDNESCKKELTKYRADGMFTPPSFEGSVLFPSTVGGINWGSVSIDAQNGIMFVNQMHMAAVIQIIKREEYDVANYSTEYPNEYFDMAGTPYGAKRFPLVSKLGTPCNPRPWGSFLAVDLKSGEVLWKVPLGTIRDLTPVPLWFNWGTPNIGGSVATAGGLVFIGATADNYLRAFDTRSGEEAWSYRLPTTANATPLTYRLNKNGKQYVVVAAGGHGWSTPGDSIMAFALKEKRQ